MRRVLLSAGIAVLASELAFGQPEQSLTFEVASVKRSAPVPQRGGVYFGPARGGPGTPDPGQITWTYALLRNILMVAYDMKAYQIRGPSWLGTERYDIVAKVPEGTTKAQVRVMWQNLLAERFGVMLHHESKEFQVEELVVAKGGSKLKEAAEGDSAALLDGGPPKFKDGELSSPGLVSRLSPRPSGLDIRTVAEAQPLSKLTELIGNQLNRPVLDKTGLTGNYDFNLEFTTQLNGPALLATPQPGDYASEPAGQDLAAALQQQLGLRLVASKATLDVLVIDKAEKLPTAN